MTILVDSPIWPYHGQMYCHMTTDEPVSELHAFAARIGLKRCWFHNPKGKGHPHYDLSPAFRARALANGAVFNSRRSTGPGVP